MSTMPIDIVIEWVDGNDPEWQRKKDRVTQGMLFDDNSDDRAQRYRDWDNLQYIFRGIEANMPWVNHIFLVTCGHYPKWINLDNPKLTLMKHSDFIPNEYLPTFNAGTIELNLHRIPNLSDHFILFNDDMFVLKKTKRSDFFRGNLPCDSVGFSAIGANFSEEGKGIYGMNVMNTRFVAMNFKKGEVTKKIWRKLYDLRNGRDLLKTLTVLPYRDFTGFNCVHTAHSYLKSTWIEAWERASNDFNDTCLKKLRPEFWQSQWAMRYWQICNGNFVIRPVWFSKFFDMCKLGNEKKVIREIHKRKHKMICINDNISDCKDFDLIKGRINQELEKLYPNKSAFEK